MPYCPTGRVETVRRESGQTTPTRDASSPYKRPPPRRPTRPVHAVAYWPHARGPRWRRLSTPFPCQLPFGFRQLTRENKTQNRGAHSPRPNSTPDASGSCREKIRPLSHSNAGLPVFSFSTSRNSFLFNRVFPFVEKLVLLYTNGVPIGPRREMYVRKAPCSRRLQRPTQAGFARCARAVEQVVSQSAASGRSQSATILRIWPESLVTGA